jgi:hypothetical protein
VVVQVAIDDSSRGQEDAPAFILAGFMAPANNWRDFSDAWQTILDQHPKIPLLKGHDGLRLRRVFEDWSEEERDRRLLSFVQVIKNSALASVRLAIRKSEFDAILKQQTGALKNQYAIATTCVVTRILDWALRRRMRQTFEFIFDEGIMSPNQLRDMQEDAIHDLPHKAARMIKCFRHDTDDNFYPLQAADLLASYVREDLLAQTQGQTFASPVWNALMLIPRIDVPLTERVLAEIRARIEAKLASGKSLIRGRKKPHY